MLSSPRKQVLVIAALALAFLAPAIHYTARFALPLSTSVFLYVAFIVQVWLAIAPAFSAPRLDQRIMLLFWLIPYCLYAAGTHDYHSLALAKLLSLPVVLLGVYRVFPVASLEELHWQDVIVAAALLAAVLSGVLKGIWNVPMNLDFMSRLFLIAVASWCWTFVRPVPRLGYRFEPSWRMIDHASRNLLYFSVIAVPLSLALHFTRWNPQWHGLLSFCLGYLQIFLFVALLEELFFRGFLQSLLAGRTLHWAVSQAVAAGLFGFFHILHAPFPNWRYVLLATIAGWFYGSAYRRSGTVLASALTHAAVDTIWRTFLSAR